MNTTIVIVSTIALTVLLELLYDRFVSKRQSQDAPSSMEESMNDGSQTSIRMLLFGGASAVIVAVIHSLASPNDIR